MRRAALLFALAASAFASPAAAEAPRRVVSINLCTDELALLLAQPGQLVSVSALVRDPVESSYAALAAGIAENRGTAEEIIPLRPDLILAGTYTTRTTVGLLKAMGWNVLEVAPAANLTESKAVIRQVAAALGTRDRAEAMISEMDARIAAAARRVQAAGAPSRAVLFRPGEGIAGVASMQGSLLETLGIGNIATVYGVQAWAEMPLEEFVQLKPDLIVSAVSSYGASIHAEFARHPAFADSKVPRIDYPAVLTRCGAPAMAEAAERIADGIVAQRGSAMR